MASTNPEEPELKGGHPPAVKVAGGVRIVQHKQSEEPKTKDEIEEEKRLQAIASRDAHDQRVLVAGAPTKGDKDFSEEAVRSFHEKPTASVQMPHQNNHTMGKSLFQPQRH